MAIVKTTSILKETKASNKAAAAFNVLNLEMTRAVIEAAEETNNPVIIQVTSGAMKWARFDYLMPAIFSAAKASSANIAIHLDHTTDLGLIKRAIDYGFSSVMYDGSHSPVEENIKNSQEVMKLAQAKGVEVELEIGKVGGKEDELESETADVMTVDDANDFFNQTQPELLAVAFGTSHGIYKGSIDLDFDLIKECANKIDAYLVMHGSSGVGHDLIKKAVQAGINKVNIGTDLLVANFKSVREYLTTHPEEHNIRKIHEAGIISMKDVIKDYFKLLSNN